MTTPTTGVPPEVQQNPLYRNPNVNCLFDALPGDVVLFMLNDRHGRGRATYAWLLTEIAADSALGSLDYRFKRVDDGYGMNVGVYSDRSGFRPTDAQIFRRVGTPVSNMAELSRA